MFKLTEEDYKRAISTDELLKAAKDCSKGVMWKAAVSKWTFNRFRNVTYLRSLILNGKYRIQGYQYFKITDPKPRTVCATRFRDRVLQRSLCNNGLYDAFVNSFIYDNLACQRGKGTTKAIERMKYHLRRYFLENHTNRGYYVKLDIHHYFQSTPHQKLKEIVAERIVQPDFQKRVFEIIDSFKDERPQEDISHDEFGERGIGLGSQCSQLLQLLYLDELDHLIKEKFHVSHYLRYMDDMIILVSSKEEATSLLQMIREYLEKERGLELNPKSSIGRIEDGFEFLKVRYFLREQGAIMTKISRKTLNRENRRLTTILKLFYKRKISQKELIQHGNCWIGFAKWRCSRNQVRFIKAKIRSCRSS